MVPDQHRAKLDPKAEEHMFVGIADNVKAWKYYNYHSRHVQISRNITFDQTDTKLYPIPNEEIEAAGLEGDPVTHEQQQRGVEANEEPDIEDTEKGTPEQPCQ